MSGSVGGWVGEVDDVDEVRRGRGRVGDGEDVEGGDFEDDAGCCKKEERRRRGMSGCSVSFWVSFLEDVLGGRRLEGYMGVN